MSDSTDLSTAAPLIYAKPWSERSNTIGLLPGKGSAQAEALRRIASQLPLPADGIVEVVSAQGQTRLVPCDDVFVKQLTRGAFVTKGSDGTWVVTEQVQHWLTSGDDVYLARHLQGNVKFFAELLTAIGPDTRSANLLILAREYGLHWTSTDQVNRRLSWMQSLGLVERWSFNRLEVTEKGHALLREVETTPRQDVLHEGLIEGDEPVDLPEPNSSVNALLCALQQSDLQERRVIIGYIPRGRKGGRGAGTPSDRTDRTGGIVDAVRNFIEFLGESASTDEIFTKAIETLDQKKSSFTQSMHTFRNMGLIDIVSFNRYAPTEHADLLQSGNEIDLVRYLHTKYRFIGEALEFMDSTASVSELVKVAAETYGCNQIDNGEVRTRLNFLTDAGLVERIDWTRYRATAIGRALAEELPLEQLPSGTGQSVDGPNADSVIDECSDQQTLRVVGVTRDLRKFANVSDSSEEFERAVARAFELLGFRAEHLGGKGRTDVLVQAELSPTGRFRAIVDAKASASGIIGDNAVKFDALKDHLKKHRADHGMVIGPDFSGRVKEWASNNGFNLLSVDELSGMIERQQRAPLTLPELRELFLHPESDLAAIEEKYDAADNMTTLVTKILEILYQEANDEDPIADGYMSLENIQFVLRKELNPRPTREAIDECLEFLSGGVVRALQKDKDKYKIADAPSNVGRRLNGLGFGLAHLSLSDI